MIESASLVVIPIPIVQVFHEERVEVEVLHAQHEGERECSRNIHERRLVLHALYNDRASCLGAMRWLDC